MSIFNADEGNRRAMDHITRSRERTAYLSNCSTLEYLEYRLSEAYGVWQRCDAHSHRSDMRDVITKCLDRVQTEMGRPTEILGMKIRIDPTMKDNKFRFEDRLGLAQRDRGKRERIADLVQSILKNGIKVEPKE